MIPITSLHQIELTSECNLRCVYCTHAKMPRPKQHMAWIAYRKALEWVEYFVAKGTQGELNLAGIGESTLHPFFVEMVAAARHTLGPTGQIAIATNGLLVTEEMAQALQPYNPRIWVSLHRPEKAGLAVEILKKYALYNGASADPSIAATNWAGQVDWHVSAASGPCDWLTRGWVMAMADGRVTTCCLDSTGSGVVATLDDDPASVTVKPYDLCSSCHLKVPENLMTAAGKDRRETLST